MRLFFCLRVHGSLPAWESRLAIGHRVSGMAFTPMPHHEKNAQTGYFLWRRNAPHTGFHSLDREFCGGWSQ
jgi:hypothetical protein